MSRENFNIKQLYSDLVTFEEENNLFKKKIQGVLVWERIRFTVYRLILEDNTVTNVDVAQGKKLSTSTILRNYLTKLKNYLLSIISFKQNPFLAKEHDIVIISHPRRKIQPDGKWWDIYTDHFSNDLKYSTLTLEGDNTLFYYKPPKTKNIRYFSFVYFLVKLKKLFGIGKVKLNNDEVEYLNFLSDEIYKKFGSKIDIRSKVEVRLSIRARILPLFIKVLERIKPKVVLIICSYGKEDFIEACKIKNIPVIELQHGVISKYHLGYSFESKGARKYTFPDYLFVFGDYWKKSVKFPIEQNKIISVGFPELEKKKEFYSNIQKKNQILFISQITVGEKLSKLAIELSKDNSIDYHIVYKLHPRESKKWAELYPHLKNSKIEIISQEKNLYQLFAESKILVGVYSTAIYEGLNFGLKVFLLDSPGIEHVENLIEQGFAQKITNLADLKEQINNPLEKKIDYNYFFESDSIENIKKKIYEIIDLHYSL
ncbi:MAG: CDP-glycerol glycerophosphotransferase family protein [Candidatus Heimdallarchaeum endolithica]|uniref:CDP-glycerol glycerophosphotransferase family protein n=1 Tax=Candidatus Heimdallarchaeum endolithica TaxID=2876572 RepID=A0A9Y1BSR3_9ARCH|nr:MAG: CDP-glycerol glycerophosphotransferase family protein [Candidatus Heimdallarchaeum endolithica]